MAVLRRRGRRRRGPGTASARQEGRLATGAIVVVVAAIALWAKTALHHDRERVKAQRADGARVLAGRGPSPKPMTTLPPAYVAPKDNWRALDVAVGCNSFPTFTDYRNPIWYGAVHVVNYAPEKRSAMVKVTLLRDGHPIRVLSGFADEGPPARDGRGRDPRP